MRDCGHVLTFLIVFIVPTALEGASEALVGELDPAWNIKVVVTHMYLFTTRMLIAFWPTQVTLIEPGCIRTKWTANVAWSPAHPAYENTSLPGAHVRSVGWERAMTWKDGRRSAEAFYRIASVPNPPLHFLVGKDAIEATRKKIAALSADIDAYEAWSEGLGDHE